MSQTYTDDCFASSHVAQTDMANIEDNFAALKSAFSGGSQPANVVPGMRWFDTTKKLLKLRNQADSGWLGVMNGDSNTKVWIYSNSAADGWVVDSTLTDVVLAIKGGSNAYAVNGGTPGGTWTQSGHVLTTTELPAHNHTIGNNTHSHDYITASGTMTGELKAIGSATSSSGTGTTEDDTHTHTCANAGSGNSHNHGSTYRPSAAVGTLQYLDI